MSNQKVREIEALLLKLHEQASSGQSSDSEAVKDTVVDLSEVLSTSISSEDLDLCISLLFSEGGLTEFCKLFASNPTFVPAKKSCLDLFKFLLEKDITPLVKYANDLEKLCRHLYNADNSSKVRCSALDVFCFILSNCSHTLEFVDFDFKKFIEQLCLDIKSNKGALIVSHQLCTLGILTKVAPEKITGQSNLIFKVLKDHLIKYTSGRSPNFIAATGAVRGLAFYLQEFPQGTEDNPDFYSQIYLRVHNLLNPGLNLPKREIQRAALDLIHEQGPKFAEDLFKYHETIFKWLSQWCRASNRDDHKAAIRALDTFIVVISNKLELLAEEDEKRCKQVFMFLLKEFNDLLENSKSSSQISLAVKGYGLLAGPCRILLSQEDVFKMFSRVLAVSHQSFFQSSEMLETKVGSLPSYIESLGIIVSKMEQLTSGMVDYLHQISMALVENFQYVSQFKAFLAYRALLTLLCSLKEKLSIYSSFLHGFVYHFVLHTCSHAPVVDKFSSPADGVTDGSSVGDGASGWNSATGLKGDSGSYRDYLPLWRTLLSPERTAGIKVCGRSATVLTGLSHHLYEEFLDCVLEMAEKLDLTTSKSDDSAQDNEEAWSDPVKGLKANTPKDFQVYLNLCCLMEELVPLQRDHGLEAHLPRLMLYFVKKSSSEPLVSTHYSVLTLLLVSAGHIRYFEPTDGPFSTEVETTKHLLTGYVSEVLQRCKQYRDDLLVSSLTLLLHLPICVVEPKLHEMVSPLQMSLQMGLSYLQIARICVTALHLWSERLEKEQVRKFFPEILPMLLPYLRSEESLSEAELQTRLITVKMALARQRRKVDRRKVKEGRRVENSEMRKVQLSILQLLGRLDQDLCFSVVANQKDAIAEQAIAWDVQKHIVFSVPFQGWKVDIFLDEILPDTVDKALNSSNRQTKVAACELLHSIIILMIGIDPGVRGGHSSAKDRGPGMPPGSSVLHLSPKPEIKGNQQSQQTQQKQPMTLLYVRVFRAMLALSCDADHVTRQLFLTLTFQAIHWFTNNRTFEHPDTAALLQVIMDGLVAPNDPSLRDLSAQCLTEFLKWSRKQSKDAKQAGLNLKSVLKRILALSQHPSAYKRLGACLAWNGIYKEVREDALNCNEWMISLLTSLMTCLGYSQEDDPLIGTQTLCQAAIDHVERILRVRSDMFNKVSARRLPNDMEEGTLKELLDWLLLRIASQSDLVRHSCMTLIMSLGPHTKDYSSGHDFLARRIRAEDADFVPRLVEAPLPDSPMDDGKDELRETTYKDAIFRLKSFLSSMDAYVWLISKDVIKLQDLLSTSNPKILSEVDYFLRWYALSTSETLLFPSTAVDARSRIPLTLSQVAKLNELRCTGIIRVMDFVSVLANSEEQLLKDRNVVNDHLRRIILKCIFDPSGLGFNLKDTTLTSRLPRHLIDFFSLLRRKLSPESIHAFQGEIDDRVKELTSTFLERLPINLDAKAAIPSDLHLFLDGLDVLHKSGWIIEEVVMSHLVRSGLDWLEKVLFVVQNGSLAAKDFSSKHHPFIKKYLIFATLVRPQTRKDLLSLLTCDRLSQDLNGKEIKKGAHVLATLGEIPLTLVMEDPSLCLDHVVTMATKGELLGCMDFLDRAMKLIVKNAEMRRRNSAEFLQSFLGHWNTLCSSTAIEGFSKDALLSLVMTAVMADKEDVIKTRLKNNDPASRGLLTFFQSFLCNPDLDLSAKARALKLLPFFLTEGNSETMVKETLQTFRLHNLPLRLSEYSKGSLRERELRSVILEFLVCLELTVSVPFLGFVVRLFCCEEPHPYDADLQKTMRHLVRSSQTTKQMQILNFLYKFFCEDSNHSLRVGILEKALIPCLEEANQAATLSFFVGVIRELVPSLDSPVVGKCEEQHKIIVAKYGAFLLIQILYSKLPKEKVFASGAEVSGAYNSKDATGKELTKEILKRSVTTAKGKLRHDLTHQELRRKTSCAAYNSLISVLSNVQDQLRFYTNFLFSEAVAKDEAIFEGFLDLEKRFHFDIEVNFDPSSRNRFVSVHQKRNLSRSTEEQGLHGTVRYMASHYLSDSSLKEELSQFDFSSAVVLSEPVTDSSYTREAPSDLSVGMAVVRLDRADFNNHEVMPNLTAIIRHMVASNIMESYTSVSPPTLDNLPQWMAFLLAKLQCAKTNRNVKLFILRLIMNTEEIFAPYANLFLHPVLSILVEGVLGNTINYFITDLIVTLLMWGERSVPQDENLASEIFKFFVACTPHVQANVFKYNLSLIKAMVEHWKGVFTVPSQAVISLLEIKNGAKREVDGGLQIAGIFLANGLSPIEVENSSAKHRFTSLVSSLMAEKNSGVHCAAAEVMGLFLKFCQENGHQDEGLVESVVHGLQSLLATQMGQALSCLYFAQKHFPQITARLLNKLLACLPRLYGIQKERALQCLVSVAPRMDDAFAHLKEQNILDNLTRKEAKTQLVSLELVNAVLPRLQPSQIEYFLPGISAFEFHSAPSCRELMYEAFIWIYNKFDATEGDSERELAKQAQAVLLKGSQDEDAALRQSVRNFWLQRARDLSVTQRLLFALQKLYTSDTEDSFLRMATHVLLEATHSSADFLRPIFQHPLTECIFREMKISPGWKARNASMIPLFVESQTSEGAASLDSLISMTQSDAPSDGAGPSALPQQRGVQETVNYAFSATQNPGGSSLGDTYNWVTGSSLDASVADKEFMATHAPTFGSASGLYFSAGDDARSSKRMNLGSSRFQPDVTDGREKGKTKANVETQLLRRRFLSNQDREKQTTHFARQEEFRRKMRDQIQKERKMKREAQVTIYRQYRVGELPDVQIPYKALIAPLQALAEKDELFASRLFQLIAECVLRDSTTILNSTEQQEWQNSLFQTIKRILSLSETCNPHVMKPLLHLLLVADIDVSPEDVSSVCLRSSLEPLGILCLERQHLRQQQKTIEPVRKKQRKEYVQNNSKDPSLGLNIADMYKSLSMWDAVLGILKSEIGELKDEIVKALEAESEKNHFEAYKNYVAAIDKEDWDVDPSRQQPQVWDEWFVASSESLGQWEEIEKFVDERFLPGNEPRLERLIRVWDLPRQSFLVALPALVKSKLMKVLHGSDDDGDLCKFIDATRSDPRQRLILESELGLPLAVLAINQEKNEEARSLLRTAQVSFLSKLVQGSILSTKSMLDHLKNIQAMSELQDFVGLIMHPSRDLVAAEAKKIVKQWGNANSVDCTTQTQFLTSYRNLYLHFLKQSFNLDDQFINKIKMTSHISVIKSSLADSNPHLAHRHLVKLERIPKDDLTDCQFNFLKTETCILRAKMKEPEDKLPYLVEAWCKYLTKVNNFIKCQPSEQKSPIESQYLLMEGSICFSICSAIKEMGSKWTAEIKAMKLLAAKFPNVESHRDSWLQILLECTRNCFTKATTLLTENVQTTEISTTCILSDPYTAIFSFFEECLEIWKDHTDSQCYSRSFVMAVLRGMATGSKESRFRFPRLFHLLERDSSVQMITLFREESNKVPDWMFLLWLHQIFIYFDKAPGPALYPILQRLTKNYPEAVVYPFELFRESFNFSSSNGGNCLRIFEEMRSTLDKFTLIRNFITAISLVHVPHIEMKDILDDALRRGEEKNLVKVTKECYKSFLVPSNKLKHTCNERGSVYLNPDAIMKRVKAIYDEKYGPNLVKYNSQKLNDLKEKTKLVCDELRNVNSVSSKLPRSLECYSPWLASFSAAKHTQELEIPGQYSGLSKPMPEYHTKVSSFNSNLWLMTSIRIPMKLTITGSDEQEHSYLVKSGEDLRTDQRVEEVFALLNNIYAAHSSPHLSTKPSLVTYQVTPLTRKVGILEWVSHTEPLKNFIFSSLQGVDEKSVDRAIKEYSQKKSWTLDPMIKRDSCINKFETVVNMIPWDLLRRNLLKLATGHEGFFHLRNTFISSYATLCISHWLLGIGDRHPSNFLFNLKTGHVVGIDFGHHFESATHFLPFPELIPFRLTRQIVNVMQPLGLYGQFRETMIACLAALKSQRMVIIAAVEAFVKEPTEDWLGFMVRISQNEADQLKFSKEKMGDFRKKLNGYNPAAILASVAERNPTVKRKNKSSEMRNIVLGLGFSRRAQVEISQKYQLSVAEQVDILIDQAIDPNILGRTYSGWQPYL